MDVHEDPDELGYWKEPLRRSDASEDSGDVLDPPGPPDPPAAPARGYAADYLSHIMPGNEQMEIVKAARCAYAADVTEHWDVEREMRAAAERHRNAAGYSDEIDPCDP